MIKNKKLALLSVTGLLGALAIGAVATKGTGVNIIPTLGDDATVWVHYSGKAATDSSYGVKEYWASCSPDASGNYGTRVFEAPTTGTIKETKDVDDTLYQYIGTYVGEDGSKDDRYIAPLDSTIKFDARGGDTIEDKTYSYGTLASALPTTTRAGDDYYETYTFGGWYKDGVAYDKEVAGSTTVKAKWNYGNAKTTYVRSWGQSDFTKGEGVSWRTVKWINDTKDASLPTFDRTDDDGMAFAGGSDKTDSTITTPAVNFSSLLDEHPAIYMEVGGYNSDNQLTVTASETKSLPKNPGVNSTDKLTGTIFRFTKDSSGTVHLHFSESGLTNPLNYDGRTSRTGDITLTDDQAKGVSGLTFGFNTAGSARIYWLGRPYYINGEGTYIDVTAKKGFTVTGADVKTKSDEGTWTGKGYWYEAVGGEDECVAVVGTDGNAGAKLTFDKVNLSELFTAGKGIKFTVGGWNGNETFYFGNTSVGVNGTNLNGCDNYTADQIENTFHNWVVTIDDIGAHVYNKNEEKTYDIALTAGQIAGTESISMTLGKVSKGRCFFLFDLTTYHL